VIVLWGVVGVHDRRAGPGQRGHLGADAFAPLRQRHGTAAADEQVQVQPVLDDLPSGTGWNQMPGARPAGSISRSMQSPSPSSSAGMLMLR